MKNVTTFKVNEDTQIDCWTYETRSTWGHRANLVRNGRITMEAKVRYYNRTWESFTYESILYDVFRKAKIVSEEEQKRLFELWAKGYKDEVNAGFGMIAAVAKMGELLCDNQKDKNDWKARMIKAGLSDRGLIMPEDWDTLSEDEKERRLNGVISILS